MQHVSTHICDDVREERGNKLSLMGLYDEAILFPKLPARLPKLCLFQRWAEAHDARTVKIGIDGTALDKPHRVEARVDYAPGESRKEKLQIAIALSPLAFAQEGTLVISTYFNGASRPSHVHTLQIGRAVSTSAEGVSDRRHA